MHECSSSSLSTAAEAEIEAVFLRAKRMFEPSCSFFLALAKKIVFMFLHSVARLAEFEQRIRIRMICYFSLVYGPSWGQKALSCSAMYKESKLHENL